MASDMGPSDSSTPPIQNPFVFDGGDISIRVTYHNKLVVGKVCSRALIRASPVWKKFLIPPWAKEDSTVEVKEIDCSEDNGEALLILFEIAHLNFRAVPRGIYYDVLFQLAILIDEYQCIQLISPWIEHWMVNEKAESIVRGQEGWLFIAWVFGRENIFEGVSKLLVYTVKVNEKGEFWTLDENSLIPELMPNGLVGKRLPHTCSIF
jgi:hypothetical protein